MRDSEYIESSDAEASENGDSSTEEALQVMKQSHPPKLDQSMTVKGGADGQLVTINLRNDEVGRVPIKALLNTELRDALTKKKGRAHRKKAKVSRKGGTKIRARHLEVDRPKNFDVV